MRRLPSTPPGRSAAASVVVKGQSKWGRMSGLVLWLPPGYDGQGAEHSSARLERFLQLCAEDNMQVVCPTTPAQVFHLLRRQSRITTRKPLVVMSPKSMLRLKASFSPLEDFTSGQFRPVISESDTKIKTASCQRLLLCSGKVYYDLLAERETLAMKDVAIVRVERLYPFPAELLREIVHTYSAAKEVFWVQEEPANQGAWMQINSEIRRILLNAQKLYRVSRPALAAPAVGSMARHKAELRDLLDKSFAKGVPVE